MGNMCTPENYSYGMLKNHTCSKGETFSNGWFSIVMLVFRGVTSKLTKGGDSLGSVLVDFTKSSGVNCFCHCEMIPVPPMVYIGMLFLC